MFNKKGFIENAFLIMQTIIIGAVASTGILFSGANPVGSGFFVGANAMVAYSQMPHVVKDFRQKKAVREFGITMDEAKALNEDELLDLIRDDEPAVIRTNGGNFINGNMNGT